MHPESAVRTAFRSLSSCGLVNFHLHLGILFLPMSEYSNTIHSLWHHCKFSYTLTSAVYDTRQCHANIDLKLDARCKLECSRTTRPKNTSGCAYWFSKTRRKIRIVAIWRKRVGETGVIEIGSAKNVGNVEDIECFAQRFHMDVLA